jgi:lipoprotein-releasing system permease protein
MFKLPFELFLGLRYTRAKRRNGFISFISLSSMLGIALGVTALITVMSIMNGFQDELRSRILGMTSHMTVMEPDQKLSNWEKLYKEVTKLPHVVGAAPNVMAQGMMTHGGEVQGVVVRGIVPQLEPQVSDIDSKMIAGRLLDLEVRPYGMIIRSELAAKLGVSVGDKMTLIAPQGSITPMGILPRLKRFTVVGIFHAGMYEYDSGLTLINLKDAQKVFKMKDRVSGLQLKLDDLFKVGVVRIEIANRIDQPLYVRDWTQEHANFFKAINMEKKMMFIVLALIIMVAAFNIVSTMVMVVTDKQRDIAVLRTLGASPMSIQWIFMTQGLIIGLIGGVLGLLGGVGLSLNIKTIVPFIENAFGFKFFPADIYYISEVPSKLDWNDVWSVTILAFMLTLLATLYPAWRASRVQPAEALRYE